MLPASAVIQFILYSPTTYS